MDIFDQWQTAYCSGHKMPKLFRECASERFREIYDGKYKELDGARCHAHTIYRIMTPPMSGHLLSFDSLYYSFSSDIDGLLEVARSDRWLRDNVFLIVATPVRGLDFNILGELLYENYTDSRYIRENEVVSMVSSQSISAVYYLNSIDDLNNYEERGVRIAPEDYKLKSSKIVAKYSLKIF